MHQCGLKSYTSFAKYIEHCVEEKKWVILSWLDFTSIGSTFDKQGNITAPHLLIADLNHHYHERFLQHLVNGIYGNLYVCYVARYLVFCPVL